MADNIIGTHVQGCLDEGQPANQEYPVLIAGKDAAGNLKVPVFEANGSLDVTVVGSSGPATATTTANCADVTQGCIADAAVTGDNPGTVSGKLRGLVKILTDVWDSVNHLLRVSVGNFPATQPVSGTVTANQGAAGAAAWNVFTNDFTLTGSINANGQSVSTFLNDTSSAGLEISGTWVGTITFFVSGPNGIQTPIFAVKQGVAAPLVLSTAVNGNFLFATAGYANVFAKATAWTSGTATIAWTSSAAETPVAPSVPVALVAAAVALANGRTNSPISLQDALGNTITVLTYPHNKNGGVWDPVVTPGIFKTVATAATGNTAIWTPAAGKKVRLQRYMIAVTDNATLAAPGVLTISLFDAAAGATGQVHDLFVPAVALNNNGSLYNSGWVNLGNGFLSAAANNVLNVNLSAALTAGNVRVLVCGSEE